MASREGVCNICVQWGKLSFEHVPPESAFNDRKVVVPDINRVLQLDDLDQVESLPGKQLQRGEGGYTLCISCNTRTGHLYGSAYASWVYQGASYLHSARGRSTVLAYPYHLFPSRVLKQIACMFFSINPSRFQQKQSDLVRFALNRDAKHLPPALRFFVGYIRSPISRRSAVSAALNTETGVTRLMSELTFYPFAYILSLNGHEPTHPMLEITWFRHAGHNDFRSLHLPIPTLDAYTPFPGDFRARDQVLRESAA